MRYRITLRGEHLELRGYLDDIDLLRKLGDAIEPLNIMVVASPADADFNPFGQQLEGGSLGGF